MCNNYEQQLSWQAYSEAMARIELGLPADQGPQDLPQTADIRINDMAPVMRVSGNVVGLSPMRWSFPAARPGGKPAFNFRSEGRRFATDQRCIIPASAFFEFTGTKSPKSKWRFTLASGDPIGIAGIWRPGGGDGPELFTMLTTSPGPDIEPYHDRQIVVLPPRDWASWLYADRPEAELLRPLPAGSLSVSLARAGKDAPADRLISPDR